MVKVYVADISKLSDPIEHPELFNELTKDRKDKILQYKQEINRKQSLGAGLLLKKCLSEYGLNIEEIRYGENGKPEIDGIYFNLSHSCDLVICAISEKPVGCDIERIEKIRKGVAERYFSESEVQYLKQFKGDKKRDEFYRLWTMKESYLKMTGEGMKLSLHRIEFVFDDIIGVYRDKRLCECNIMEYKIPGYQLTVCAEENELEIICCDVII